MRDLIEVAFDQIRCERKINGIVKLLQVYLCFVVDGSGNACCLIAFNRLSNFDYYIYFKTISLRSLQSAFHSVGISFRFFLISSIVLSQWNRYATNNSFHDENIDRALVIKIIIEQMNYNVYYHNLDFNHIHNWWIMCSILDLWFLDAFSSRHDKLIL